MNVTKSCAHRKAKHKRKRTPRPELQDGRTFYDFTLCSGEYVGKAQTRKAIMSALRNWSSVEGLRTSAQRKHVADQALADTRFLTSCSGQVVTAVARDVVDAFLRGRWPALAEAVRVQGPREDNTTSVIEDAAFQDPWW